MTKQHNRMISKICHNILSHITIRYNTNIMPSPVSAYKIGQLICQATELTENVFTGLCLGKKTEVILTHWAVQNHTTSESKTSSCSLSCLNSTDLTFRLRSQMFVTMPWQQSTEISQSSFEVRGTNQLKHFNTRTFTRAAVFCNQIILHNLIYSMKSWNWWWLSRSAQSGADIITHCARTHSDPPWAHCKQTPSMSCCLTSTTQKTSTGRRTQTHRQQQHEATLKTNITS